ncbi:MAG: malto-oligosyltrehalose trehalohydrolase, partial [Pirellulales bacterium]|nr:malto-oligosyltrehalose trehalohydrolase [Pirellulales bacterium]
MAATAARSVAEANDCRRRLPVGAEVQPGGGVHFRVWAPRCRGVRVQIARGSGSQRQIGEPLTLEGEEGGYFAALVGQAAAGDQYWYHLDDDDARVPDPASRFQPEGPHGPSEIIDPAAYAWRDRDWNGLRLAGQVIYEMHLGTFTPEGTWVAAARELAELARCGITLVEVMPVAAFPGRFNWGYDGVDLYAPTQIYGHPDDLRRFVDAAHELHLGVILDVVYNHVGPDGNYLKRFAEEYFTDRHVTDWGAALNYDGPGCEGVREFFVHNAGYWIDEFHLDGLRLDATQNIYDESDDHLIAALTRHCRQKAGSRQIVIIAENESQQAKFARPPSAGGYGIDGLWNDDFHHAAHVALTGHNEAYYSDYRGVASELLSAAKFGYLSQGQWSQWQEKRRGTPSGDLPPWAFITFLENHDQVSNSLRGERTHEISHPGRYRALTTLLLLGPGTPMLFQGQEFGATTPFLFFADHRPELAWLVWQGRREFLTQFPSLAAEASQAAIDNPADDATFARSRLNLGERETNRAAYRLHQDLLRLRREEPVLRPRDTWPHNRRWIDGAMLTENAFVLRYFSDGDSGNESDTRLLIVNLGPDVLYSP